MAKLMAPNIRIDWYPEGHFAVPSNPSPAELNSGYNLSPAIVTGFTLDFTDTSTVDVASIFDHNASEMFTHSSYEANLQFFLAPKKFNILGEPSAVSGNEAAYRMAEQLFYFEGPKTGYLVKRFGYKWDTPYDITHKVDVFKVHSTTPKVITEEDSPILLEVMFLPVGEAYSATDGLYPFPRENLIRNGDFEQGLEYWSDMRRVVSVDTSTTWNDRMWGGLGGSMLYVSETLATSALYSYIRQDFYGKFLADKYLGVSGYFAAPEGTRFRIAIRWEIEGTSTGRLVRSSYFNAPLYEGIFIHETFEIPSNVDVDSGSARFQMDINSPTGESTRFWADKIMLALGNTREEALENSAVYKPHRNDL